MMKRTISIACLLLVAVVGTLAQHWTVDAHAWQYDMTVYARLKVNGTVVSDYADYEVAVFCGNECRGVAKVLTVEGEAPMLYLRIRSNVTDNETITFRVYQASTDVETQLEETLEFESQSVAGTPGEPMLLTISSILKGDVNNDGNITAQDASLVLQLVAKKISSQTPGIVYDVADVNGDGQVTAQDASLILQYVAKKISW